MQTNLTHVRSSPVLACSATGLGHIAPSRTVFFRRVRFGPRKNPVCKISHLNRYQPHETFPNRVFTASQKRITLPKNKPTERDGPASGTCDDEKESSTEEEKKSSEFVKELSEEEEKKCSEFLEGLGEEEKKKISEFVEGLSEEQKIKISEILLGLREEGKNEFVEGSSGEEDRKVDEFVEGLSGEGKRKISKFLKNLSKVEEEKIREYVEVLSEEEKNKICELLKGLSEEGMKKLIRVRVTAKSEEETKIMKIVAKGKGLSAEDIKKIKEFFDSLGWEEKKKVFDLVEGFTKEKKEKNEEKNKHLDFFREADTAIQKEKKQVMELVEAFKKKVTDRFQSFREGEKKIFKELKESLREEAKKCARFWDLAKESSGNLTPEALELLSKRSEFVKNVLCGLGFQVLSGIVAYGAIKMRRQITAGFKENYFQLFSLLLNGRLTPSCLQFSICFIPLTFAFVVLLLVLPTCQAFKDMFFNQEKGTLNSIPLGLLNGAIAALGVVLADENIVSSSASHTGVMISGVAGAFIVLSILVLIAGEALGKGKDLSCFRPSRFSVAAPIIASLIPILNRNPFTTAIEASVNALAYCMLVLYETENILKHYGDDDYPVASARIFWDLYGLLISFTKILECLLVC